MPVTIGGSPTHVLVVHVVVVLLPASVIGSLLLVTVPATRRAFALLTLAVTLVACLAIPLAFVSGSALARRLPSSPLISNHVRLAHELLPLAAVFGLALAAFVAIDLSMRRHGDRLNQLEGRFLAPLTAPPSRRLRTWHQGAAIVLVVLAVATGVQVYRVGDAGAKAAWSGRLDGLRAVPCSTCGRTYPPGAKPAVRP